MPSPLRLLFAFLLGLALMFAIRSSGWAANHNFTPSVIMAALTEKMQLHPTDKFSVETREGSALVEYKGVVQMPGTDDYAIVINVRRW